MFEIWSVEETKKNIIKGVNNVLDWESNLQGGPTNNNIEEALEDVLSMDLSNEKVRCAIQMGVSRTDGITLIMGPGGCGKSLIYKAIAHCVPRTLCLAPTGVAANNLTAHGWGNLEYTKPPRTIHSGLGLSIHSYFSPQEVESLKEKLRHGYWSSMKSPMYPDKGTYNLILIDEISMVSPNILDLIIAAAGELNIPLVLFGDPMQLRPIAVEEKKRWEREDDESNADYRLAQKYSGWNFFNSFGWMFMQGTAAARTIVLDSVYRQSDPGFKSMLNRIRINEPTEGDWALLASRCSSEPPEDALILCKYNKIVNKINSEYAGKRSLLITLDEKALEDIPDCTPEEEYLNRFRLAEGKMTSRDRLVYEVITTKRPFKAIEDPECKKRDRLSAYIHNGTGRELERENPGFVEDIRLYAGDRVMITKNCEAGCIRLNAKETGLEKEISTRVVNGMLGYYLGIGSWENGEGRCRAAYILLDTDEVVLIPEAMFVKEIRTRSGEYRVVASAEQYPIKLAYATTYHKAQGLTLDKVHMILDGENSRWQEAGLGYLGLSRCKTLEGLTIDGLARCEFVEDKESKNFMSHSESRSFC